MNKAVLSRERQEESRAYEVHRVDICGVMPSLMSYKLLSFMHVRYMGLVRRK